MLLSPEISEIQLAEMDAIIVWGGEIVLSSAKIQVSLLTKSNRRNLIDVTAYGTITPNQKEATIVAVGFWSNIFYYTN